MSGISKRLGHDDISGFEFAKELLGEDTTAAINFDRLQKHPKQGYIIIEYLLCEEAQTVTPYTSHPNRYWNQNATKFLSLWRAKQDFNATLYLVNYAKKGTKADDEVLLIEVLDIDENGIIKENRTKFSRTGFAEWFKNLNRECLSPVEDILIDVYSRKKPEDIGQLILQGGKYKGKTIEAVYEQDESYLHWLKEKNFPYSKAVWCFLQKLKDE